MTHADIAAAVEGALALGRFFVPWGNAEIVRRPTEQTHWEVYRGHLLGEKQTRETAGFESWDFVLHSDEPCCDGPLLSVKYEAAAGRLHVTRNVLVHAWETWEPQPNVLESRPTQAWHRELVGTLELAGFSDNTVLENTLRECLYLAVVGTSRLPTTSLESPLPAFSLGRLAYFPGVQRPSTQPLRTVEEVLPIAVAAGTAESARALEALLRASEAADVPPLAEEWAGAMRAYKSCEDGARPPVYSPGAKDAARCGDVLKALVGQVSLSPYTRFGDNFAALLRCLSQDDLLGPQAIVDLIGHILRHLARHLTAFDLVTFHNRGANYPDALFLDRLLRDYAALLDRQPELFLPPESENVAARRRRRALRQAVLIRRQYEGHPVTEIPTSPGENLRVWPAEFPRVPDDELQYPVKRRHRLYANDPLEDWPASQQWHAALRQAMSDVRHPAELRELGTATFLDRPLGVFMQPGEVDRTPLVSYEAVSREIAAERLGLFRRWGMLDKAECAALRMLLEQLPIAGIPAAAYNLPRRPGVPALEDAQQAAGDFVFVATTRASATALLQYLRRESLPGVPAENMPPRLIVRAADQAGVPAAEGPLLVYEYAGRFFNLPAE